MKNSEIKQLRKSLGGENIPYEQGAYDTFKSEVLRSAEESFVSDLLTFLDQDAAFGEHMSQADPVALLDFAQLCLGASNRTDAKEAAARISLQSRALLYLEEAARMEETPRANSAPSVADSGDAKATKKFKCPAALHQLAALYNTGIKDVLAKDPDKALELLQGAAMSGHPVAMYDFAVILEKGIQTHAKMLPKNVPAALALYKQSAELDCSNAQLKLAKLFETGLPGLVKQDVEQSVMWLRKAARNENAVAALSLGVLLSKGLSVQGPAKSGDPANTQIVTTIVEKNPAESLKWIQNAAKWGDPNAQYNYGQYLFAGVPNLLEADPAQAYELYVSASSKGHQQAKKELLTNDPFRLGVRVHTMQAQIDVLTKQVEALAQQVQSIKVAQENASSDAGEMTITSRNPGIFH